MCRQVSESPIVLPGFLFLHVLTHFYICLSIVLKRVHLDPHPWRSLFACVGAHLCFFPCLSLMWSSFPLLGRSLQPPGLLERKWVLACFTLTSDRCVAWTCTTRAQQFPCPVTPWINICTYINTCIPIDGLHLGLSKSKVYTMYPSVGTGSSFFPSTCSISWIYTWINIPRIVSGQ